MASLTIRGLDDRVKAGLRVQAARNGRSMEAEARAILAEAVIAGYADDGLGSRIAARFAGLCTSFGVPPRHDVGRALPSFGEVAS